MRAFKPGLIQVNEQILTRSIIVTPDQLIENWMPQTAEELSSESFAEVIALKPDILLIGTGETHVLLPVEIYGELVNRGIGVEVMNTGAACRTFNALSAENRRVVAALVIR
ncbi:MAG: hypothetical protein EPO11_07560 [Gammaproteobacteria bacterium]|nr:MAG: hypothetical protein EPO11_07560 [Gammaproteobacteria bacterium]